MTENQKKLMPYVEARVECIVSEKEEKYKRPLIATESEIMSEVRDDVLECMRELYRMERYVATSTLNHPALMKNNNDRNKENRNKIHHLRPKGDAW